jgi:lipopolysaccharide export system permease protein
MLAVTLSLFSLFLGEVVVPFSERRQKELYNIDIRQKDKEGSYSQADFWWRDGRNFYTADLFDSRQSKLISFTHIEIDSNWNVMRRTDAKEAKWIDPLAGWTMRGVGRHHFDRQPPAFEPFDVLPLPVREQPSDFYEFRNDPSTMSFTELWGFIAQQKRNGIATTQYLPDLYSKLAFPFVIVITAMVVLPFTLRPARSGSMAFSSLAAIFIAFGYYAVNSFSISMGRAELLPPALAAWMANIVMSIVAVVLNLGAEAPQ